MCGRSLLVLVLLASPLGARAMGTDATPAPSATPGRGAYAEAVRLIETADFAAAARLLEGVVAVDPGIADAWSQLGFSRRKLGDWSSALAACQQALALQPLPLGANEYLGELYIERGRVDLARERLEVLADACGVCPEYLELRQLIEGQPATPAPGRGS